MEEQEFAESRNASRGEERESGAEQGGHLTAQDGFLSVPDDLEELPFD